MPTKRRGNNEGSISQLPSGSFRAQVSLDGQRIGFTFKTRKESQEWIKKTIGQIDNGMTLAGARMTVGEFLSSWLTSSRYSMESTTWNHFSQLARDYVIPYLGKLLLKDLRTQHIQELYNGLRDDGVGVYTVRKTHDMLHSAFEYAAATGLMVRNASNKVMLPSEPYKEMQIPEESQVSQMLLTVEGTDLDALLQMAVTTGMRQMELLALRWSDIDWVKATVTVECQLVHKKGDIPEFKRLKTKYSRRTIDIGAKTLDVLRRHAERQHAQRRAMGEKWLDFDLIFPKENGGQMRPRYLLDAFKTVLRQAGLPTIRFHDLRHTAASIMLKNGIPVLTVSRRLGHARPSITLDIYGHLISSMQAQAAALMDDLVTPVKLHTIAHDSRPSKVDHELHPHI